MRPDLVSIIEATYVVDGTEREWFTAILEAALSELDDGLGLVGGTYEIDAGGRVRPVVVVTVGVDEAIIEQMVQTTRDLPPDAVDRLFTRVPVITISEAFGGLSANDLPFTAALARRWGSPDAFGVVAHDPVGVSGIMSAPLRNLMKISARKRNRWMRISAHIAAGLRIRRRLGTAEDRSPAAADAILESDGRVVHAQREAKSRVARMALRDAALAMDHARGRARHEDADEAVTTWRALVAGQWSLVDHVDHDGRRYLVARSNPPRTRPRAGLSERERQVVGYATLGHSNKLIAYELGLGESVVSAHLRSAAAKLGARSRVELIGILRAGVGKLGGPDPKK